uniref:Globin family profile domain-containing protein n=1 Tax=Caenorhabditis japonica TaxID=281687 RepID=A0A8R1DHD5_CAEJA
MCCEQHNKKLRHFEAIDKKILAEQFEKKLEEVRWTRAHFWRMESTREKAAVCPASMIYNTKVFDKLVKNLPNIRDMFSTRMFLCAMSRGTTSTLRDHSKNCVRMVEAVIKNFDVEKSKRNDTGTENDPRVIGRAHSILKPYGLAGNYWEKFGEVMIDVVLAQEAVRDLPGAGQAWVIFTACLVDQMRAGFDENRRTDPEAQMKKNTVLHYATQQLLEDKESRQMENNNKTSVIESDLSDTVFL